MSHLSNLTYDNNNTRLLYAHEELFPSVNIDNDQNDSNKLLLNGNLRSSKYHQGSQLFNNYNSNLTLFFEQNSNFISFHPCERSISSEIDKTFKSYHTPIINSRLIINEKKEPRPTSYTVINLTQEKMFNKANVHFTINDNHPLFLLKKRLNPIIEPLSKKLTEEDHEFFIKVKSLKDLRSIDQDISISFKDNENCFNVKPNAIISKKNNDNYNKQNKSLDIEKSIKNKDNLNETLKPKTKCKCNKSKCLQYYCECFQNGSFCKDCQCQNCFNNEKHKEEGDKARQLLYLKNKKNKGKSKSSLIQQGCKCSKSNCQKKYCECYNHGRTCSKECKCLNCKNTEQNETILNLSKQLNENNFTNYKRKKAYELFKQQSKPQTKFLIDKNINQMFNKKITYNEKSTTITSTSSTSLISCKIIP